MQFTITLVGRFNKSLTWQDLGDCLSNGLITEVDTEKIPIPHLYFDLSENRQKKETQILWAHLSNG